MLHKWQHDETGRITECDASPGPRWTKIDHPWPEPPAAGVGVPKEAEPRIVECNLCALRRNADTCPVFRCPHKLAAGVGVPDGR